MATSYVTGTLRRDQNHAVKTAFQTITDHLPFLIDLSPDECKDVPPTPDPGP